MVPYLSGRSARRAWALVALALALTAVACGSGKATKLAGPGIAFPSPQEIPQLREPEFGTGGATTSLGQEQLVTGTAAVPPGLHITTLQIAVLSKVARDALKFTGFRSGHGPGLLTLPIYGINPQLGMYYLVVPVVNEGPEPVRNLAARADFYDANGIIVWSEQLPVTHLPTRLGLNPPSLPNSPAVQPLELGLQTHGFNVFYFAGNVGLFTFAVPDTAVAATVKTWSLTFLVSQT